MGGLVLMSPLISKGGVRGDIACAGWHGGRDDGFCIPSSTGLALSQLCGGRQQIWGEGSKSAPLSAVGPSVAGTVNVVCSTKRLFQSLLGGQLHAPLPAPARFPGLVALFL